MKKLILDKNAIFEYQQNREPYLMIDYATEVVPGISSKGYKDLKKDEWFFEVHWPNDPNMPGMLQIEALVQMSSLAILTLPNNKGKIMYLTASNNLLNIETKIKSFKRGIAVCNGVGTVGDSIVCKADFTLILPDQLKIYNLKKN